MTYPTFLSKRIKNSASTLGASPLGDSPDVVLDSREADMVVLLAKGNALRGCKPA